MKKKRHIVISGTGRAGTTFLIELFTKLGLDTGFNKKNIKEKLFLEARAGLENDLREENCPYIVKDPWLVNYIDDLLMRGNIFIDYVIIPIRDLTAAAESRRFVVKENIKNMKLIDKIKYYIKPKGFMGGLFETKSMKKGEQEKVLLNKTYELLYSLSKTFIPVIFINYPKSVKDSLYLYEKLKPILPSNITYNSFKKIFNEISDINLVHSFSKKDI